MSWDYAGLLIHSPFPPRRCLEPLRNVNDFQSWTANTGVKHNRAENLAP